MGRQLPGSFAAAVTPFRTFGQRYSLPTSGHLFMSLLGALAAGAVSIGWIAERRYRLAGSETAARLKQGLQELGWSSPLLRRQPTNT